MSEQQKLKVAVVCGYSKSMHGIAIIDALSKMSGIELQLVACVKTFTTHRVKQLMKRYGMRDALEKFRNVFLRNSNNRFADETAYIKKYLVKQNIIHSSVNATCKDVNVEYISIGSVEDKGLLKKMMSNQIDLLVYSGGGIVRRPLIQSTKLGVLNAHSAPLPFFRGMNGLEWTLLHGVCPEVTVHLIDAGIDTGPILYASPIEISKGDTIESLRGKSVVVEVKALLYCVQNFKKLSQQKSEQDKSKGKQYFIMHRFLKDFLNSKLNEGWRPAISAKDFRGK